MIQNVDAVNPNSALPGIRKAAILMIVLGDQISGEILRQLDTRLQREPEEGAASSTARELSPG